MKYLPSLPASPTSRQSLLLSPWTTLLSGVLFCTSPALTAQSVTFAGTQTTLPANNLVGPNGDAVDGAGDVFISDTGNNRVVELPRTATGYGPQATLPTSGLFGPAGMVVDGAGDVFIVDSYNKRVVELPWAGTGYGPQTTLPFNGTIGPWGVALDSAGDVFITDSQNNRVLELPQTGTGYGAQTTLPFSGLYLPVGIALDSAGDVFIADAGNNRALELPQTGTGYGAQTTLPFSGLDDPYGLARDSAGDVFIADILGGSALELPRTSTGYGPEVTLPFSGLNHPIGVAVDSAGDLFLDDAHNNRVLELQTRSVNFEGVNVCASGFTMPAHCNETLTLNYNVSASGTLGTPKVLTGGAPDLDFTLASGSTCTGAVTAGTTCTVNVTFTPLSLGTRNGSVEITGGSGNVLATTLIYGLGQATTIDFSQGFGQAQGELQFNGSASLSGTSLLLTDGLSEKSSVFFKTPVNVQSFTTDFNFQLTDPHADGFTFTIQNIGPTALGVHGGEDLGYAGIGQSVAVKFDLFQDPGDPSNDSTGIFVDGAVPIGGIDLSGSRIKLHSGDEMDASITYDGATLTLTITDLVTLATWSHQFAIDIPSTVGGNTAYVGFTAGTGGLSATQQILSWTFE